MPARRQTEDQIRNALLDHIAQLVDYWDRPGESSQLSQRMRLEGLAYTILVALDGQANIPRFQVIPVKQRYPRDIGKGQLRNYFADTLARVRGEYVCATAASTARQNPHPSR